MNYNSQLRLQDLLDIPPDSEMPEESLYGQQQAQQAPVMLAGSLFGPADVMSPQAQLRYREATGQDIRTGREVPQPTSPVSPGYSRGRDDAVTEAWKLRNAPRQDRELQELMRKREQLRNLLIKGRG